MNFKLFVGSLILFFLISFIFAQSYPNYANFTPSMFLENEWVVFGGIFLIIFALAYIALNNAFSLSNKGKINPYFPWVHENPASPHYKGAIVVISLVIAFFSASVFVQRGWIYLYFGEVVGAWLLLVTLIIVLILSIPFYKALKTNVGNGPAIVITFLIIWATIKFFINPDTLIPYGTMPPEFFEFFEFFTSVWTLVIAGVIGVLFTILRNSSRR